jgi:TatA/E family protein of Tat protein translocase
MGSIGAGEILLLAMLALLLFGPKRLPDVGRQVGRALAEIRRVSREFEREVRDVTEPFHRELRDASEPLEREVRALESEARKAYALDDDLSTFVADADANEPKEASDRDGPREA